MARSMRAVQRLRANGNALPTIAANVGRDVKTLIDCYAAISRGSAFRPTAAVRRSSHACAPGDT